MSGPRLIGQPGFPGLNLRDAPDASEALDALNVVFRELGALDTRPGSSKRLFIFNPGTGPVLHIEGVGLDDSDHILLGWKNKLNAHMEGNPNGATLTNSNGLVSDATFYTTARVGLIGASQLWIASDGTRVRRLKLAGGLAIDSPTISIDGAGAAGNHGNGTVVGVTPWDARLLLGGFRTGSVGPGGQPVDRDKIFALEPGNTVALKSDSFFRVGVGDGEDVMGMVTWRESVFIFKETCFWVFSGISPDASGGPLFQRRPVAAGLGAVSPEAITTGRDGVYFLAKNGGIYRTNGGEPKLVSELVEPVLTGRGINYFTGGVVQPADLASVQLHWNDELLYVNFKADGAVQRNRQLVYDTRFGWWSLYDLPATAIGSAEDGTLIYGDAGDVVGSESYVWQQDEDAIGDACGLNSTLSLRPFRARWRSGWTDFANPEVKVHAAMRVWGSGSPTLKIARDFRKGFEASDVLQLSGDPQYWGSGTPDDTWGAGLSADDWGPSRAVDGVMRNRALPCSHFSYQLEDLVGLGVGEPFSVHRLTHYVRDPRSPSSLRTQR